MEELLNVLDGYFGTLVKTGYIPIETTIGIVLMDFINELNEDQELPLIATCEQLDKICELKECLKHGIVPFIIEDNTIKYIDYDLDLRVFPSGEYKILDVLEYNYHRKILKYSDDLDTILQKALEDLIKEYVNDSPMFDGKTNYEYYAQFLKIRNKIVHKKQ